MKRSEINRIMQQAVDFLDERRFRLPPFAFWSPQRWQDAGPACRPIVEQQLGWDITDFGLGDFDATGLFLFTLRNGVLDADGRPRDKDYAEKILIVRENQVTPTHFHWRKMEDIINRGGGALVCQLWSADEADGLADTDVLVHCDGVERTLPSGGQVVLEPGESITLPPRLYHKFWGRPDAGTVLVGEVSRVNDDRTDNQFIDPVGRFPEIDEDEPPLHLLVGDYARYGVAAD